MWASVLPFAPPLAMRADSRREGGEGVSRPRVMATGDGSARNAPAAPEAAPADLASGTHSGPWAATTGDPGSPGAGPQDFEALYDAHFDFVWRSVRRLGIPEASVDDAVQDVFVVAFRRLVDFERRSTYKTWLFGIALRVVRAHRRTAKRRPAEPLGKEPRASDPGPLEETERRQAVAVLDQILDQMDDDKRAVFVMAELEGMTAPEIALATETKLNTVYSRLRAARKTFEDGVKRHRARDERRRA
jgi:RNA polymerase sigma-70 factor (ECF subfamily)